MLSLDLNLALFRSRGVDCFEQGVGYYDSGQGGQLNRSPCQWAVATVNCNCQLGIHLLSDRCRSEYKVNCHGLSIP